MKRGLLWAFLLSLVGIGGVWSVHAATFNSSNFSINGNLGDSAAGGQSSTSYNLTSAAGESIAGQSSSSSYKLGQGYTSQLDQTLQLTVQPNGQQLYLPFDEGAGNTVYDETSNMFNGTVAGTSAWTTGKVGGALTFNGTTSNVTVANNAALSPTNGTISAWVKTSATTGSRSVVQKDSNYSLLINANKLALYDYTTTTTCEQVSTGIANGVWRHVALTYQSGVSNGSTLYVDGVAVKTCTMTLVNTNNPVIIGDNAAGTQKFDGQIDEVKTYNRVLGANEIDAEYDAGAKGNPAGLGLGTIVPNISNTSNFNTVVQTDAPGYNLAVSQDGNLQAGGASTPDFAQDFSGFTNGQALTAGNTGFDSIGTVGSATATAEDSSPVQGRYAKAVSTTSSTYTFGKIFALTGQRYFRTYMRFASLPAATETIFVARDDLNATVSSLRLQADGTIILRNGVTGVDTSTTGFSAGDWVRLEHFYDSTNSQQTLRIFNGANVNGTTPSETLSGAATNGPMDDYQFGMNTGQANQTLDMDEIASSTDGWIGPTGSPTIPAVSSSIASPAAWSEGTTKGLGFSLLAAPGLDGKWGSGANYAAFPLTGTTFYTRSGYGGGVKDVVNMRLRLDINVSQPLADYSNNVVVTGTMIP